MARYANAEELKRRIQKRKDTADSTLEALLEAAGTKIDRLCNRPGGFLAIDTATARHWAGSSLTYQLIDECVEVTAVAVKDSPSDVAYEAWTTPTTNFAGDGDWIACTGDQNSPDFVSLPYTMLIIDPNGDQSWFTGETPEQKKRGRNRRGRSLLARVPTVEVTARWGYSATTPDDIREACIMQSARWYKRLQGAMSDSLASAELGQMLYLEQLDPDIAGILLDGRYVKPATGRR